MTALQNTGLINGEHDAAPAATLAASGTPTPAMPTPETRAGIAKFRQALQLSVGQIVLATMNLPRYRHQTLADLEHLFVAPLMHDRVAIARKAPNAPNGAVDDTIVGIAVWATVSDAVDAKITEQIRTGVFPVRLGPDDWASGGTVWLLDVVARDRQQATLVLANFRQLAGGRAVKIAPLVTRLIDPAVVAKLRGAETGLAGVPNPEAGIIDH
jgi:cytolysin-activating lysine-acyltransferase